MNQEATIKNNRPKHAYFDGIRGKTLLDVIEHARYSSGVKYARKYRSGEQITLGQAVLANCAECMGWYVDGMRDCECPECPIYHWMPYRAERRAKTRAKREKNTNTKGEP